MGKNLQDIKSGQTNKKNKAALRMQAESRLADLSLKGTSIQSAEQLLHELRVHHIELEMQNETLREAQLALEQSRDRYVDLYEFAPVGYLTLTRDGLINEVNLTGAALLGVERNKLIRRRFATLVCTEDRDIWYQIFIHALQLNERQSCELVLQRGDGSCFHAQLDGLHRVVENSISVVRLAFTDISKLKEADERYRMIFEHAADGIAITDAKTGEIIELNRTLVDMVGKDKTELIGKPISILCPTETDDSACNTALNRTFDKQGAKIETQFLSKDGHIRPVELKISDMIMNGRKVELWIIRDVAESRIALANETRLRHILDHTLDMIFIFSPDTLNFVYTNKGASKRLGYTREEMLKMSPMDIMPISESECRAFIAPLVSGKKLTRRFETMLERRDERRFPVEVQLQLIREEDEGELFVGVVRDIARRKLAENELRNQKNLMWQVIDMDPNIIFVRDEAGRFLLANQAIADFYGVSVQELIGKSHGDINPNQSGVIRYIISDEEVIKNGREVNLIESLMQDGEQHWYRTVKRPLQQADGTVNVLGISVDITELKQSEIRLDESYKELQRLALHLENVRAEERAQIARNLHDEMGATLAALKMRASWLASKLPDGMPHLSTEVGHISELVSEGIKTLRQVVSDLRPNLLDDVGLVAAIKDYVKKFQRDMEIKCTVELPEQDIHFNESQSVTLFRIIQESLNNVARHAQASNVLIQLVLRDDAVVLKIEDNGIGFDTSRKERSFGLLGIKERALMIGGSAAIESTPGSGTRVLVSIPLVCIINRSDINES